MDEIRKLDYIAQKLQVVAEDMQALRRSKALLQQENKILKAEQKALIGRIGEIVQNFSDTRRALARQREDETGSVQDFNKQIEQYIQEIDKCIAWFQDALRNDV